MGQENTNAIRIAEWLLILVTFLGPIAAVQTQKWIERARETRQRKLWIFYTLMATRAARTAPEHVQALNSIDLSFYRKSKKEKAVVDAWKIYLDHLCQPFDSNDANQVRAWTDKGVELFTDLLEALSKALGYGFDRVRLKRGVYYPRGHGEAEQAQIIIRDSLAKILSGQQPIPMAVTNFPSSQEAFDRQQRANDAIIETFSGKNPLKVSIEPPPKMGSSDN